MTRNLIFRSYWIWAIFLVCAAPQSRAETFETVKLAIESFEGFTSRDGTGLYHEVFNAAFETEGIEVTVEYLPVNRAMALVESGAFDMTGGLPLDDRRFGNWPILDFRVGAMHHEDTQIDWADTEALKDVFLVGSPQTAKAFDLPINEVDDREQALRLLLSGRAAAYVDLEFILQEAMSEGDLLTAGGTNVDIGEIPDGMVITTVRAAELFMLFSPTERGLFMQQAYDRGMSSLAASGKLDEIYSSYNQITPSLD